MMNKRLFFVLALLVSLLTTATAASVEGQKKANLVCFVKFADETDDVMFTDQPFSHYEQLFNSRVEGEQSVYNYFKHSSYGLLDWTTSFFPAPQGEKVASYQASQPRGYYQEKSSINPNGWDNATTMAARERALIKEVIAYIDQHIGSDVVVDADGDGMVDNLTLVLSSCSELGSRHMLWPHRSDLVSATGEFVINNAKVVGYLIVFDEYRARLTAPTTLGTICHEMSHSLGTYDLYHVNDNLNPVGIWDLMSDNQDIPQQMTVYTKYRYCKWVDEIPEISAPGTYTLNPVGGTTKENIAYKIKPVGHDEYFVVEYRKQDGYDASIPESGLIVYRINPNQSGGNVGYNGTTRLDEQYIFRPGGSLKSDGNVLQAAFSKESGRTAFGGLAAEKPFYSDGTVANFAIANVSNYGETISFELLEMKKQLILSEEALTLKGAANSGATVTVASDDDWTITGMPDWLTAEPANGKAGTTQLSLVTNSENATGAPREAVLTVSSTTDAELTKTLTVTQEAKSGSVILFDDFENVSNPNGWVIENEGENGSGWQYGAGTTTGKGKNLVYSGTHALLMKETVFEDKHQVSVLTSPAFAGGKTLSFYSHCNGGNATPRNPPVYIIEVSSDGGATWTTIFDVLKDYPRNADGTTVSTLTYTKIVLDLSPYTSNQMKIRFNCYDNTQEGLQYWWQIDDLEISSESATAIEGVKANSIDDDEIYDLQGHRVTAPLTKGIYIVGGRKVLK
jgi:M6 family metalloprotease-like protein